MSRYAHPEMLVDTAWVAANLKNPKLRMVEVDVDALAFEQGHVPGAVAWNWTTQLCDTVKRDIYRRRSSNVSWPNPALETKPP